MTKIADATQLISVDGTELLPCDDGTAFAKSLDVDQVAAYVADRLRRGVKVQNSATQTVATSTWTELTWDTEVLDHGSYWSNAEAARLVVPANEGGTYLVSSFITLSASNTASLVGVRLLVNGTVVAEAHYANVQSASVQAVALIDWPVELNVGDYVTLEAWQNSGGNRSTISGQLTQHGLRKLAEA
jgi:hypothetical protein